MFRPALAFSMLLLASPIVLAQGGGQQPPPTDTATPAIPGVAPLAPRSS